MKVSSHRAGLGMGCNRCGLLRSRRTPGTIAWVVGEEDLLTSTFLGAAIRKPFAVIVMIVLASTLAACTATSPVAPTNDVSLPSETTVPAEPTSILIGAEKTDVVDENGNVLVSLRYFENGDAAVAAAIEILGEPQGTHHQDGSNH